MLLSSGCEHVLASSPTPTPAVAFTPRYASAEEYAAVARDSDANCGKPYFGTYCRMSDGTYAYVPEASR